MSGIDILSLAIAVLALVIAIVAVRD